MRVEQFQPPSVKPAEGAQPTEKPAEAEGPAVADGQADQVALSRLSRVLSGQVEPDPRLDQLHGEVAAGSYHVPAPELSRRIIDFHLGAED